MTINKKPGETLLTRGEIARQREQILASDLSDREKIERLISVLEDAKNTAKSERARDANPRNKLEEATAALNGMCVPPEIPIEDEIDLVLAKLRDALASAVAPA